MAKKTLQRQFNDDIKSRPVRKKGTGANKSWGWKPNQEIIMKNRVINAKL